MNKDLEFLTRVIDEKSAKILDANDKIWEYAELAFHETKSAALLKSILKEEGFALTEGDAGIPTCFTGTFSYGTGKPVMGILGEYDALSSLSQKAADPHKEPLKEGAPGHGCGHCALGTGALAAALAVREYLIANKKDGTIIYFGCPAEEGAGSKQFMARAGMFDDVDFVYSWHPATKNAVECNHSNAIMGANFYFKGVASHAGATPYLGRSALDAVELMNVGCNYLREHIISDARVHYAYRDVGGIAPNVVQGHSRVHYFIRAPKSWQVKEIYKRVVDVAEGAAKMTGTEMTYELYAGLSDYIPNHVLSEVLHESMEEIGAPKYDEADFALASKFFHETATPDEMEAKRASLRKLFGADHMEEIEAHPLHTSIAPLVWNGKVQAGSTDVGDASYVIPTAMCKTATATLGTAAHTWQMTAHGNTEIAHKAMLNAGEAMALAALKTMESPEILKKAHDEWLAETNGIYECPIPKEVGPRLED